MDQIMIYDKSFQQRLQEYKDILGGHEILPVSQVKKEWSLYLELVLDPFGWQAVWKIPRISCEKFNISYPTIVLVYIESLNLQDLSAIVKILAVQDDINLPESHIASLYQLWPTKQQDETVCLDLESTANALDMLRFFYNHIWLPWDIEDDDDTDWISKHLEARLRLYYDMRMGIIPKNTAEHFRSLIIEAKSKHNKLERLEEELTDTEYNDDDFTTLSNKNDLNEKMESLTDLHIRMAKLKTEIEIIENPVMRSFLLKKEKDNEHKNSGTTYQWLVFKSGCNANEYLDYLQKVKDSISDGNEFKTATSLQNALDNVSPNDEIILGAGKHYVTSTGALELGGVIRSIQDNCTKTVISSANEDIMLDFSGVKVTLENLTLNTGFAQCGIIVRSGSVKIKNCQISGKGESSTQQGILILTNSEIVLENCHISGFSTGIFASANSKVTLINCNMSNLGTALKIFDNNKIKIDGCTFSNCKEYGIYMETESKLDNIKNVGDISLLKSMPNVEAQHCSFESNSRGNVIIAQKSEIFPVRDLFSNPAFNTTLMKVPCDEEDSETGEDMEI